MDSILLKYMNSCNEILHHINTVLYPIKINSNTIEIIKHNSCDWVLYLLCVIMVLNKKYQKLLSFFYLQRI